MTCPCCGLVPPSSQVLGLTDLQRRVLRHLEEQQRSGTAAPSYDEIARAVGMRSKSRVCDVMRALVERGHVRRPHYAQRSIVVIGLQPEARA